MTFTLTSLSQLAGHDFDDIIDVRTPAEFAEDHLPGAINLPVLDGEEHARVGTLYKQVSPFTARKLGAALVSRNAARHLEGPLADRDGGWKPLVYCWRGGQRSGSFEVILKMIGWRVERVEGGYKRFRGLVVDALYEQPFPAPVVLLDGNTGSAKTDLLKRLPDLGVQVLDLEGLANHRGSLFGAMGAQPQQRGFETALAMQVQALDPTRPVLVEAESAKVGNCRIPPALWKAMRDAPRIEVIAPLEERADYLTRAYADVSADMGRLHDTIDALRRYLSADQIAAWHAQADAGDMRALARSLMELRYDPTYTRHRARMDPVSITPLEAPSLAEAALPGLAERLAETLTTLTLPEGPRYD
ncbi:tRNA 2-selenouridine(34) synthase MnmH [Pseudooceanicola sp. CBS1P-1]|uniref:tRNA 2-selenouridine(34) synthase MnmH n=1 Tax=Pseudooceanicola albus TaxID=2692189 RepID=A0A6L7G953_9RHOB|nr:MULTISPECIES: tRNA 2-selenouridine(34) synthase MnmH [Pseudooceanicola]MBT9382904.1 tRNA 2-selenouridine(34) synthase MnmH [Pseudooceanicola endophyticus]MXN20172.1 tRNA 2-selenouridine(34) synthase MnmH [Pseudooceanicola albus]